MVEPITAVRHVGGEHGSVVEVRSGTIAILGNAELSRARLRLQGDLLGDLGKAPMSSIACMAAQRQEHGGAVHAIPVSWRSVMGLHLRGRQ